MKALTVALAALALLWAALAVISGTAVMVADVRAAQARSCEANHVCAQQQRCRDAEDLDRRFPDLHLLDPALLDAAGRPRRIVEQYARLCAARDGTLAVPAWQGPEMAHGTGRAVSPGGGPCRSRWSVRPASGITATSTRTSHATARGAGSRPAPSCATRSLTRWAPYSRTSRRPAGSVRTTTRCSCPTGTWRAGNGPRLTSSATPTGRSPATAPARAPRSCLFYPLRPTRSTGPAARSRRSPVAPAPASPSPTTSTRPVPPSPR